ncbi:type VII secretion protein EccB [Catellatospora tritici]|uniref:type VII secretion protein EccB n=1 Tax=Catellatospora tritici TaxID=2851566 RepID=UPI001C2D55C1|nr:type VII secretion protein EccB [Catellatospora tritici]MBV1853546.1 type VII secretion protein EccB [Catellatospora tritici]
MYSRQEQVHAHRFVIRRIKNALILGEPDALDLPLARAGAALIGGLFLVGLLLVGLFVYGQIKHDQCFAQPTIDCVSGPQQ